MQPPLLTRLTTVSVFEAGGKPSTRFPPGGLVEPTSPLSSSSDHIKMSFLKKIKKIENLENHEKPKIYPNFPTTALVTSLEQMNSRIAP